MFGTREPPPSAGLILVSGNDRFHLAGTDDGANLTDDSVYCGTKIP